MNIIALAPNSWFGPWMNRQQLLSRLGRKHKILYANGALHSWMRQGTYWRQRPWFSRLVDVDRIVVDEPGRLLSRISRIRMLDDFVISMTIRRWRGVFADAEGPLISHLFHPSLADYPQRIRPDFRIYHAYDLYSDAPGWSEKLDAIERRLVSESDLVIGSSAMIVEHLLKLGAASPVCVPNGVDFRSFSEPPVTSSSRLPTGRTKIGYVGAINRKVDLRLLNAIALARTDWLVVLVGGVGNLSDDDRSEFERLRTRKNVLWINEVARAELPEILAELDVGLLAYKVSGDVWTRGIYPLKMHEYLAAGLPVVSSAIPAVGDFNTVIDIVSPEPVEWIDAIDRSIPTRRDPGFVSDRRRIARANDWNVRADQLDLLIDQMVERSRSKSPTQEFVSSADRGSDCASGKR